MMKTALLLAMAAVAQAPATNQMVSQAEIDRFVQQVKACWNILPEDIGSGLSVTLLLKLGRDGSVIGNEIAEADASVTGQRLARSAMRAVEQCAPYTFSTDTYEQWQQLRLVLEP